MKQDSEPLYYIVLAFFIIYIVWGSTYLANAWALQSFPPFLLSGIRFLIAGIIMLTIARIRQPLNFSKQELINATKAGFMFFAIGNGLVVWGLQFVDSGIAALLIALQPVVIAIMLMLIKNEFLSKLSWVGLIIGILGMVVLIGQPKFIHDIAWIYGFIAIFLAIISWGFVSIWISNATMPKSVFLSAALQMFIGGCMLLIMSFSASEYQGLVIDDITMKSIFSMIFLIIFGSIIAFTAFNYLLLNVSPVKVSTSTYINPIIALFLGWWLNNEQLSSRSIIASLLLLLGVFMINMGKRKAKFCTKKA